MVTVETVFPLSLNLNVISLKSFLTLQAGELPL